MLEMLQRSEVSNPPAFGAKIASLILGRDDLRQMWYADMFTMSDRIRSMRKALYDNLVSLGESLDRRNPEAYNLTLFRGTWLLGALDSTIRDVWISGSAPGHCSGIERSVSFAEAHLMILTWLRKKHITFTWRIILESQ